MSNEDENNLNEAEPTLNEENKPKISRLSKFLTLVLRHQPNALNLDLDNDGWLSCTVDELVSLLNESKGFDITREDIEEIVKNDPKGRYEISDDDLIRATYGHSVKLNPLEYPDDLEDLPEFVYYATNNYQLDTMLRLGLIPREKRDRMFLHLSVEIKDAYTVAKHHSRNPALVKIDVEKAHTYGVKFRKVAPLIVVSEEIPSQFIEEIPLPEELQYLTHFNPERRYQRNQGTHYSKRRYEGSDKRYYKNRNRGYQSSNKPRPRYNDKSSENRFQKSKSDTKEEDFESDKDLDLDSSTEFGDINDIKKKAQSKSTIHFETEKDEDVNFN